MGKSRHAKSLEWFLLNLMYGEPSDLSQWMIKDTLPKPRSLEWKKKASDGLPDIPNEPASLLPSNPQKSDPKIIETFLIKWKEERETYPGWVICPQKNRDGLWKKTQNVLESFNTLNNLIECIEKLDKTQQLLFIYELNWRIEKVLVPLEEWQLNQTLTIDDNNFT